MAKRNVGELTFWNRAETGLLSPAILVRTNVSFFNAVYRP